MSSRLQELFKTKLKWKKTGKLGSNMVNFHSSSLELLMPCFISVCLSEWIHQFKHNIHIVQLALIHSPLTVTNIAPIHDFLFSFICQEESLLMLLNVKNNSMNVGSLELGGLSVWFSCVFCSQPESLSIFSPYLY